MAKYISKYFTDEEMRCPCCGILFVDPELLELMDQLRELMGEPLYPSSGCRCPKENKRVKGSTNSYHLTEKMSPCQAVDIRARVGHFRYRLIKYATELGFGGLGIYNGHLHVDIRSQPTAWRGDY